MAINNQPTIKPRTVTGLFTKYIPKVIPLAFDESMSYYECLCALLDYINKNVIPALDNNAAGLLELQEFYEELQSYVNNYFDNLDVQEEINNKLDDMVEDGVLEQIIEQFLQLTSLICFDNVAGMKASTNLANGSYAKTLGYYSVNDGGGATYKVRTITNSDVVDEASIIALNDNTLVAELIIENSTINFRQLGATPGNFTTVGVDCKQYMDKYIAICNKDSKRYKLFIPEGHWYFTPTLISRFAGVDIEGQAGYKRADYGNTRILPYNDNQSYVWKIGGKTLVSDVSSIGINDMTTQSILKNLMFTCEIYNNVFNKVVTDGLLYFDRCMYFIMDNIFILDFEGMGMTVRSSWEFNIGDLVFRNQKGVGYGCLHFAPIAPVTGVSPNVSAFDIKYLMFEKQDGYAIRSDGESGFSHNHIGHINMEHSFLTEDGTSNITLEEDISSYTKIHLISGFFRSLIIDSVNFFHNLNKKLVINGTTYYFASLFKTDESVGNADYNSRFCINIGCLTASVIPNNRTSILYSRNSHKTATLEIGNLLFMDDPPLIPFDCSTGCKVKIGQAGDGINTSGNKTTPNDAINYNVEGRCTKYDSTSPSLYGLTISSENNDPNRIRFKNPYGDTIKVRVLAKNPTSESQSIAFKDVTKNTNKFIVIPANTDWAWYSNAQFTSGDSAINDLMYLTTLNCLIAKIEIEHY